MNQGVEILRALAARAAECAADPVNAERAKLYRAVNDRHMVRPVVLLEEIPWNELAKEEALRARCTDPDFAALETYLRRERIWAVVGAIIAVAIVAFATWYNLDLRPTLDTWA